MTVSPKSAFSVCLLVAGLSSAWSWASESSMIEATATFKGGVEKKFRCAPAGPTDNKYQPSAASSKLLKELSFNLSCVDPSTKSFFGMSFKVDRTGPGKVTLPANLAPFPDGTTAPGGKKMVWEVAKNTFSVRALARDARSREMSLHSFPQLPQHYTEAKATLTDYRFERDAANGKWYHFVSGEGSAKFVEKFIDAKLTGEEGTLVWKFSQVKALHAGPQ